MSRARRGATPIAFLATFAASASSAASCTEFDGAFVPADAGAADGTAKDGSSDADAGCAGPQLHGHDTHCYRFVAAKATWQNAESDCVAWGGHLVAVSSQEEHLFVVSITDTEIAEDAGGGSGIWIGLSDTAVEGTFVWTTGDPVQFTSWAPGEPNTTVLNQDCAFEYAKLTGNWDDFRCDVTAPYVCER